MSSCQNRGASLLPEKNSREPNARYSVSKTMQLMEKQQYVNLNYGYSFSPNHWKTGPFKIWTFLSGFQMVFDKIAAFCPDFNWLGFRLDFRFYFKSRPFATRPFLDHSKSRLGWISDLYSSVFRPTSRFVIQVKR